MKRTERPRAARAIRLGDKLYEHGRLANLRRAKIDARLDQAERHGCGLREIIVPTRLFLR
jgi:hypothetical protein